MKFFPVMRNTLFALMATKGVVRSGRVITTRTAALLLLLLASITQPALAQSQTVVVDCLPPWEANDRFRQSTLIKHPSLSLNGFDCGNNCDIGYGLKQVLEKVYGANQETEVKTVFKEIVKLAKEDFQDITSFGNIRDNTARLQARGFVALAAYVLENNDYDPTDPTIFNDPGLPSAAQAVDSFRTALVERKWKLKVSQEDDGIKWTTPVTSVARAIDFYFALENAYKHYNIAEYDSTTSTSILSTLEKFALMNHYSDLIQDLEGLADTGVPRWISEFGSSRYNVESGNAPLKMQVAIGYAALIWQRHNTNNPDNINGKMNDYVSRSFKAAGYTSSFDRHHYWEYQSGGHEYFWAEGAYYFHLTLSQIIPFWHTARINGLLSDTSLHPYHFFDPFTRTWFLNPLHWLADISTPDGKTPPLDDGHKINMYNASLLRWTEDYGDDDIGRKFAWISKTASRSWLYPVEIAIPRRAKPPSSPLAEVIGNTFEDRKDLLGRQEVVVRRTVDDRQHYILLNGETRNAISRGEGHEQGDQMQLLYYVDDISYLVDSGYDRPVPPDGTLIPPSYDNWRHSTWNPYTNHNVMTMKPDASGWHNNNGGVRSPFLNIERQYYVQADHQNVNEIYHENHGNIDLLSSSIGLLAISSSTSLDPNKKTFADYYRNVLFIRDSSNSYLIDINAISGDAYDHQNWYKMYYHVNSNSTSKINLHPNTFQFAALHWDNIYVSEQRLLPDSTNNSLYIQPFTIERPLYFSEESDKIRETRIPNVARGVGIDIKKMLLRGNSAINGNSKENFTTIALIRALPNGEANPDLAKGNRSLPSDGDRTWQYITWKHDSTTVDVVASRSAKYYVNTSSTSSSRGPLHFSIAEADSFYVELPYDLNYGFVRLTKQNEIWNVDPSFQLNLKKSVPIVTIYGPSCIREGATGHYTSSRVTGGKPPYLYSWKFYRTCPRAPECNAWNGIGTTEAVDFGGHNGEDFKIRLQVTDSSSPARSSFSSELDVQILSPTEGGCPSDPDGKKSSDTEETLVSDTDLLEADENIPEAYALRQNFPNPFNPSTEIQFDLPEDAMVLLVVYDVLGREVARLVQEELRAGTHRAHFDAGNLPSGVYFYRIQAGDFHRTHRMTLLK